MGQSNVVPATMPPGVRAYVIGDVHGRSDLLNQRRLQILADLEARPIRQPLTVMLGDYVDRGPDSRGVLEILLDWPSRAPLVALRGNHEQMMLNFLRDHATLRHWAMAGGLETLQSYGVPLHDVTSGQGYHEAQLHLQASIPPSHVAFLAHTGLSLTLGDYFFCHAGVRPDLPLDVQMERDLLWIRDEFLASAEPLERVIVHGHTPVVEPEVLPHRINLDTGAYATDRLTCAIFEAASLTFVEA